MPTTTRLHLRYPVRADTADVPRDVEALAEDIDIAVIGLSGPFASRPAVGVPFRLYRATDKVTTDPDHLTLDTGTAWETIVFTPSIPDRSLGGIKLILATVTDAELAAASVGATQLKTKAVTNAKINDEAVDDLQISRNLKPSQGASDNTEAIRALGPATGKAAKGLHTAEHLTHGGDPLVPQILIAVDALPTPSPTNEGCWIFYRPQQRLLRSTGIALENITPLFIFGAVASDGTVTDGTGFTCTHVSLGHYQLNFSPALPSIPQIFTTAFGNQIGTQYAPHTINNGYLDFFAIGSSSPQDTTFSFVAIAR